LGTLCTNREYLSLSLSLSLSRIFISEKKKKIGYTPYQKNKEQEVRLYHIFPLMHSYLAYIYTSINELKSLSISPHYIMLLSCHYRSERLACNFIRRCTFFNPPPSFTISTNISTACCSISNASSRAS